MQGKEQKEHEKKQLKPGSHTNQQHPKTNSHKTITQLLMPHLKQTITHFIKKTSYPKSPTHSFINQAKINNNNIDWNFITINNLINNFQLFLFFLNNPNFFLGVLEMGLNKCFWIFMCDKNFGFRIYDKFGNEGKF